MIRAIREWLLIKLANEKPVAMNLHLKQGLHVDGEKTKDGLFYNINVHDGEAFENRNNKNIKYIYFILYT